MRSVMIDADSSLPEVSRRAAWYINKSLRVPVHQGKPAALYLDHDPVSLFKSMSDLVEIIGHFRYFPGDQRLRLYETVSELAPEYLGPYQPLIAIRQHVY